MNSNSNHHETLAIPNTAQPVFADVDQLVSSLSILYNSILDQEYLPPEVMLEIKQLIKKYEPNRNRTAIEKKYFIDE